MTRSIVRVALASLLVAFALVGPAEAARERVPLFRLTPGPVPSGQLPPLVPSAQHSVPPPPVFRSCFVLGMGGPPCNAKPHACLARSSRGPRPCAAPGRTILIRLSP